MITALLVASAFAQDAPLERQYRRVQLVDGRILVGEVLDTRPEGLLIGTQQGEVSLSYELLVDMAPVDESVYAAQDPWLVLLAAKPDSALAKSLASIPAVVVWTPGGTVGGADDRVDLTDTEQTALRGCAGAAGCMKGALGSTAGWRWIVTQGGGEGESPDVLHGLVSTGDTTTTARVTGPTDAALWTASHEVLGLVPPTTEAPFTLVEPRARAGGSPSLAFAPLPGLPALAAGDGGRFALALGVAIPATAAWVGVVGTHAETLPEHAALSAVGFYAITVLTNELLGPRDGESRREPRHGRRQPR